MVAANDFQDYMRGGSRLMQQAAESPLTTAGMGVKAGAITIPAWTNSIQVLVVLPSGVSALTITGATTGFTYLTATPALDGGLYYCPVFASIDTQLNFSYYQNTLASVKIYAVLSDEPISIATLNPIAPTESFSEHQEPTSPHLCAISATTVVTVSTDTTTKAVRCSFSRPSVVTWGKIVGTQSGVVYYDGSAANANIPSFPVQVDSTIDTSVDISINVGAIGSVLLYVSLVNNPDFGGQNSFSQPMTPNTLAVPKENAATPNQRPLIFDGTIALSATLNLLLGASGRQLRLHAINIMQWSAVATEFDLEDTNGNKFFHYHWPAANNALYSPLFGQLAANGAGLQLHNLLATVTASLAITLWYSVL